MTRAAWLVLLVLCAACSRGTPPPPAASEPTLAPTAAATGPTEAPSGPTEAPTETVDLSVPLEDLVVIPGVSDSDDWVPVSDGKVESFQAWLRTRSVTGEARQLAEDMDDAYGFESEARAAYVRRRGATSDRPRSVQVLVSRFERGDDGLSEAWCSVDEEGREAVELGSSPKVQRAVDRLVALPGSCGAVREAGDDTYAADISFRRGPLVVQVVAVERTPIRALQALSRAAERVHERVVELTD